MTAESRNGELREFRVGDIVRHFKREYVNQDTAEYLYRIVAFASHTETGEKLVIYEALYPPYKVCARPYEMFISPVCEAKATIRYRYSAVS